MRRSLLYHKKREKLIYSIELMFIPKQIFDYKKNYNYDLFF